MLGVALSHTTWPKRLQRQPSLLQLSTSEAGKWLRPVLCVSVDKHIRVVLAMRPPRFTITQRMLDMFKRPTDPKEYPNLYA